MSQFDEAKIREIMALVETEKSKSKAAWNAQSIFDRLDRAIIGNTKYKQSLALSLSEFINNRTRRMHLLVSGPSGSGKTYLLQQCVPDFELPYLLIDASGLVPSGYVGNTLRDSLTGFFSGNMMASRGCIVILDEFDKLSEFANGGDIHKSHSLQSELLTLIQGIQEGAIDTRNSLWIFAGAFSYTDEMKQAQPKLNSDDLIKYGFKNELLGRIQKFASTDLPSTEDVVRRVAQDEMIVTFFDEMKEQGFEVEFDNTAFLELAMAAQNPKYGMRIVPKIMSEIKEFIIFGCPKGVVTITKEIVKKCHGAKV
ncbi:AAA family ATPase [Bdellovibrionota bacterium FG-1]